MWVLWTMPSELRGGVATLGAYRATRDNDPLNYWLFLGVKPVLGVVGILMAIGVTTDLI